MDIAHFGNPRIIFIIGQVMTMFGYLLQGFTRYIHIPEIQPHPDFFKKTIHHFSGFSEATAFEQADRSGSKDRCPFFLLCRIMCGQMDCMKTRYILYGFLSIMAGLIAFAFFFREQFVALLDHPSLYGHVLFVHVAASTLFFANAVVGMLWEMRSLASGRKEVILHTYATVSWLDARFSSPLIILSLVAGLSLSVRMGSIWETGWLSLGFILFIFSGLVWIVSDIPTQYKVKRLMGGLDPGDPALPEELVRLLKLRRRIGIAGVAPLLFVFALMIYKPGIPACL
jgi:uncharacterized membrane protein